MKIIFQFAVVLSALLFIHFLLRGRSSHAGRAWKKMGFLLLIFVMVLTVFFPWITDYVAHFVGIGRGADLLIYGIGLTLFMFILNSYLHQQDNKEVVIRLARQIAIVDAKNRNKRLIK